MLNSAIDSTINQLHKFKSSEKYSFIENNTPLLNPDVVRISAKSPFDPEFYPFSVFDEFNKFFIFNFGLNIDLKTVTSKDAFCCISDILNSIVTKEKTKGSFSFNAADAVSNSRSSVTSFNTLNAVKWKTFKEFGRYAYFVYLPDPVLGVNDINNPDDLELHRTLLSKIADDTYTEQRRLTSISYLAWCDRYIMVIENRSRRFAACAYLAKSGDEYFNKPFDIDIYTQNIDFDKISELDSIVDTYALIADNKYHNALTQLIHDYDVPAGVFRPKWNRDYLGYDVRVYFLLKDEFIEKTRLTTNDYSEYADHYLKSRAPLKQQFDVLKDEGLCVSFSDMVKNLRDAWTVTTNNQSK